MFLSILSHRLFLPSCIALALLLRLGVIVFLPVAPESDAAWYVARALELVAGEGYRESGLPTAYWPIGWPAILAAGLAVLQTPAIAVGTLNLIGAAATMLLMVWFGRRVLGDETATRLALLAYCLYPNHIAYGGLALSEIVYTALVMAAFALLIAGRDRLWQIAASGLLFGLCTLVKPQTLLFPIGAVIALALVYRGFSWLRVLSAGLVVYFCLAVVVLPWSYRNLQELGSFVLVSTNGGTALLLGANDHMTGGHFDYQHTPAFTDLGIPWEERVARQVELDRLQKQVAGDWIRDNPGSYIAWMPRKVFLLWYKDTEGFWSYKSSYPAHQSIALALQALNQVAYLAVLFLSLFAAWVAARALLRRDGALAPLGLLFCMPLFVTLLAAVFTGQIRYHFAAMPFLFLTAAWSLAALATAFGRRQAARPG